MKRELVFPLWLVAAALLALYFSIELVTAIVGALIVYRLLGK